MRGCSGLSIGAVVVILLASAKFVRAVTSEGCDQPISYHPDKVYEIPCFDFINIYEIKKMIYPKYANTLKISLSFSGTGLVCRKKNKYMLTQSTPFGPSDKALTRYLQEEIQATHHYEEIIGASHEMSKIFRLVSQVAASDSSVLILGETGTGKELIARALHNHSERKVKVMVKVNCATLPANLVESELFGHEKGSFTGAYEKKIGKFELAHNSTLFLDEVGELPLDLQVKLLRALQEKEIERVGGRVTIKTNARIIAATNCHLQKDVQAGKFRADLYFRLNVIPIYLPPLRERKEDILSLADHFLHKYARKTIGRDMHFSARAMKELLAYNWPGNVRELEHQIERSILLTNGTTIDNVFLPAESNNHALICDSYIKSIDEVEREHIVYVLRKTSGKVAGIGGAAELLRIPSTTLNSKMKRLKIQKRLIENNNHH
jgi:formate hydrogenlyase transcriptional activator